MTSDFSAEAQKRTMVGGQCNTGRVRVQGILKIFYHITELMREEI
jgi:hypothetical protein